jgi:nucleoside-diphosphate-sugar epimerase
MDLHPRTAAVIADAVRAEPCRSVHVSSYWSYLPVRRLPVDEDHPRSGGNAYIRLRREAEDVLRAAGAAVVHLPDFFGPEVHTSTLQRALEDAVENRPMSWIGSKDTARDAVYVPDAMVAVAELASREEAFGSSWIVPGSGPIDAQRLATLASEHLGRQVGIRAAGPFLLRLVALFTPELRPMLPMVPHYARAITFDGGRLEALIGRREPTPYAEAVPITLDWIRAHREP